MARHSASSAITGIVGSAVGAIQQQISAILERGRARSKELEEERAREDEAAGGNIAHEPILPWTLTPEEDATLTNLQTRVQRLNQVQSFFRDDPELMHLVDSAIAKRTQAASRRQTLIAVGVALASLVAGWLLSAVSPVSAVTQLFGR
jgi:hypothetical protein